MKIPVDWLREYVPVPQTEAELLQFADALTMAGLEVEEILPEGGPTFYTKITPNRGDWASVYGTAREAAAALSLSLKPLPKLNTHEGIEATQFTKVTVEDGAGCPRYLATIVRGMTVAPSPMWMQERLTRAGMRPVNNIVDVTNYVMLELGQPLHAFDLDTLPGGEIVVRRAWAGETLRTLDDVERSLTTETLCICDRDKPIAIAGILGGGPTEVTDATTNILLESAHFDPLSVRRTAKRFGIATEASYRFERFVDPNLVPIAANQAAQLLAELGGGTVVSGVVDVAQTPKPPRRILARMDRIRKLLGADVDRDAAIAALERLGCSVERSMGSLDVGIPAWRPDLTMEDDIAEEVGRIALGYANLPETLPPVRTGAGSDSPQNLFLTKVSDALVGLGFQEARSHALTAPSPFATEDEATHRVLVRSALSAELSSLRTSLLPNLLHTTARAYQNGIRDVALFEAGQIYRKESAVATGRYAEPLRVAGVLCGQTLPGLWAIKSESALPMDFWYARDVVEATCSRLHLPTVMFQPTTHNMTHSGRTANVLIGETNVGLVAELSEATVVSLDLPRRVYVFDLDGAALLRLSQGAEPRFHSLPRFPSIMRDLAPVLPSTVPFADVERVVTNAAGEFLESLRLTDVFENAATLGDGRRSLTLRLTFRAPDATLKDATVESALSSVRQALTQELRAEIRG